MHEKAFEALSWFVLKETLVSWRLFRTSPLAHQTLLPSVNQCANLLAGIRSMILFFRKPEHRKIYDNFPPKLYMACTHVPDTDRSTNVYFLSVFFFFLLFASASSTFIFINNRRNQQKITAVDIGPIEHVMNVFHGLTHELSMRNISLLYPTHLCTT